MKKLWMIVCSGALAGCATMDEEALSGRSTVSLCNLANAMLLDGAAAERVLTARHGEAWMHYTKTDQQPHIGDHICVAIYTYGPADRVNRSAGSGWRSNQYVFDGRYIYTDASETISGWN